MSLLVTVCICTFRRPEMLRGLLLMLGEQKILFSVVVVDNDATGSARVVIELLRADLPYEVRYFVESERNIAAARNRALDEADGRLVAFLDDDEYPKLGWLEALLKARETWAADAVLGPVVPEFVMEPPAWVRRSRLCNRPRYLTGTPLEWDKTRTGNVLFDREIALRRGIRFDTKFGRLGGEDVMFFRRYLAGGAKAVWCDEAVVREWVTPERATAWSMLRRAFRQGYVSFQYRGNQGFRARTLLAVRGLAAILVYAVPALLCLPFTFGIAMRYLVKGAHHASRTLTALGVLDLSRRFL